MVFTQSYVVVSDVCSPLLDREIQRRCESRRELNDIHAGSVANYFHVVKVTGTNSTLCGQEITTWKQDIAYLYDTHMDRHDMLQ